MKSKKLTILSFFILILILLSVFWLYRSSKNPLLGILEKEWLDKQFPSTIDTADSNWEVLPFGYTLGPWPKLFRESPIVTKLTYNKGPPTNFIHSITQLWQPVEVELSILGPKTLVENMSQQKWKECFESRFSCNGKREKILDYLADKKDDGKFNKITWFDHLDQNGARGVHLFKEYQSYRIDNFVLFTENGIAQGFKLKTVKTETGNEARLLLYRILGTLQVKEDLTSSREWIQKKIRTVQLTEIQKMRDSKMKLIKLIEIQNWLFSLLTVNPTEITPFFHLAGVTHLLALELIKLQTVYFENQESWILNSKPNLNALLKYSQDFNQSQISKQVESLIQDILLQQQKATTVLKK